MKFVTFLFFMICNIFSVNTINKVYIIEINDEIGPKTWRYVDQGIDKAQEGKFCGIILHLNTYGGTLEHADSIRTKILNCSLPVYAFVDNNVASAGALISIACDKIFMREGANIGASTVVDKNSRALPDKYQSYMRSMMRSTAESHGKTLRKDINGRVVNCWVRDPIIAEAMVDPKIIASSIGDDSSSVVTLTAQEALQCGYNDGMASSIDDVCSKYFGLKGYDIVEYHPTWIDFLIGWLTNHFVQGLLIMIIIGGIFFELHSPGLGVPPCAALTAAVLYFLPLYIEGYAAPWEIIMFVVGLILIFIEIFIIPSFGIVGISGIIIIFASLMFSMLDNVFFNFELIKEGDIAMAMFIVAVGLLLGVIIVLYISHKIGGKGIMAKSALQLEQKIEDGYVGVPSDMQKYVGKTGIALSVLRPSGKIKIGDNLFDAVSINDFIEAGESVKVLKYENTQLYVSRTEE